MEEERAAMRNREIDQVSNHSLHQSGCKCTCTSCIYIVYILELYTCIHVHSLLYQCSAYAIYIHVHVYIVTRQNYAPIHVHVLSRHALTNVYTRNMYP